MKNKESRQSNKQNFSVQQTESTIPTSDSCTTSKSSKNTKSKKSQAQNPDKESTPQPNEGPRVFCACDVKPDQAQLNQCTCQPDPNAKLTFSEQHQTCRGTSPQTRIYKNNTCNTVPLYSVSGNSISASTQCPYPYCPSFAPPPCPTPEDLWELQFCRWWNWNLMRQRQEYMSSNSTAPQPETSNEICKRVEPKDSKDKKNPYDKFVSWCCRKAQGDLKCPCPTNLGREDKRNLQEMYDTPCSSIILNKKRSENENDLDTNYSTNMKGFCHCTSASSIVVRKNKKKKQSRANKQRACTCTESTTSNEVCKCVSAVSQRSSKSSTGDSIEFLSLIMKRVKSEHVYNDSSRDKSKRFVCHHNVTKKKQRPHSCSTPAEDSAKTCNCGKRAKNKNTAKPAARRHVCLCTSDPQVQPHSNPSPPPSKVPIFKRYLQGNSNKSRQNTTTCNCHKGSQGNTKKSRQHNQDDTLTCDCHKGPQGNSKKSRQEKQHDTAACNCHKRQKKEKEYKVCCVCEKSNKKSKVSEEKYCPTSQSSESMQCTCEHKLKKKVSSIEDICRSCGKSNSTPEDVPKVYVCCCCKCCNCCNSNHDAKTDEMLCKATNPKKAEPTGNKIMNCSCQTNLDNVPLGVDLCNTTSNNADKGFQKSDNSCCNVSDALGGAGFFPSPVSGRLFTLNPKTLTCNPLTYHSQLPQPMDINDPSFFSKVKPVKSVDVEHRSLLQAVCNAIMSSRTSLKGSRTKKGCKNEDGEFARAHSREVAVHLYDTDTDPNEPLLDLFTANSEHLGKNTLANECSKHKKQRSTDFEALRKISYSSLKKIYNESSFPFKRCRVGKNVPVVEQGDTTESSPSTCNTRRSNAPETPCSSVLTEDDRRCCSNNVFSSYNVTLPPKQINHSLLQNQTSFSSKHDTPLGISWKDVDSNATSIGMANQKISCLSHLIDLPGGAFHSTPSSVSYNLEAKKFSTADSAIGTPASCNVDFKKLPTFIRECQTSTTGPSVSYNIEAQKLPTIKERQTSTTEASSDNSECRPSLFEEPESKATSNRESPLSLCFTASTSKLFGLGIKHGACDSNIIKFLKKKSSDKIDKHTKLMGKRWR